MHQVVSWEHMRPKFEIFPTQLGGVVASWSVCLTPDRMVQVQVLAGDIVLCSWARHGASLC